LKGEQVWQGQTNRGIGTAEAANSTFSTSVKPKEGKHMDIKAITHGFMLLIVDLKKLNIRVHFCQLTNLQNDTQIVNHKL